MRERNAEARADAAAGEVGAAIAKRMRVVVGGDVRAFVVLRESVEGYRRCAAEEGVAWPGVAHTRLILRGIAGQRAGPGPARPVRRGWGRGWRGGDEGEADRGVDREDREGKRRSVCVVFDLDR